MNGGLLSEIGLLLLGTGLLWKGADWVIESACRVARRFRLSEAVIGATVLALGTSAAEVMVTLVAAFNGRPEISLGNVIGSNVFNLGLILGGCATVWVIPTTRHLVHRDAPVLLLSTLLLILFFRNDGTLSRWEGLAMMVGLGSYLVYLIAQGDVGIEDMDAAPHGVATSLDYFVLVLGLGAITAGAHLLVDSASALASMMGFSTWVIGVTVVAAGTSLPELATSLMAARRGHMAMMAGTLVGSDLFNVLGVLGLAAFLHPLNVGTNEAVVLRSLDMMVGMVVLLIVFMRTGWRITRAEGGLVVVVALLRWGVDIATGIPH